MNVWHRSFFSWILAVLLLVGCRPSQSTDSATPTFSIVASPTIGPTATTFLPTSTASAFPMVTPTVAIASSPAMDGLAVAFVSETIPDGTQLQPGESFTKTWTIRNSGTVTWSSVYDLFLISSNPANER